MATEKPALIFCYESANKTSIAALSCALAKEALDTELTLYSASFSNARRLYHLAMRSSPALIICLSFMTAQERRVAELLRTLRSEKRPQDLLIAGGSHPSANISETLAMGADIVFYGEAELSFPFFIRAYLEQGDYRKMPGIAFLSGGRVVLNASPPRILLDMSHTVSRIPRIIAPLELSRGCFFRCRYCYTPMLHGSVMRHRSSEDIAAQLVHYPRYLTFLSPNALAYGATRRGEINVRAIVGILEAIQKSPSPPRVNFGIFPSEVRPEYVTRELIRDVKPLISNKYLTLGMQSGSDHVLRIAQRDHTVRDVLYAVDIIRAEGMGVLLDIICGLPGEQKADRRATFDLLQRVLSNEIRARLHRFTPLPATPFANEPPGRIEDGTLEFLNSYRRNKWATGKSQTASR
jgi:B12-binding domain/radical SAM domain protein